MEVGTERQAIDFLQLFCTVSTKIFLLKKTLLWDELFIFFLERSPPYLK